MDEPHQRTQSGKLRKISKRANSESGIKNLYGKGIVFAGIESTTKLDPINLDDSLSCYQQTPCNLTNSHVNLLQLMANGYGIVGINSIDPYWKNTWNIGVWCIGSNVSLSVNIMQPNISSSWATIVCRQNDEIENIAKQYKNEGLARSTAYIRKIGKGYELKGRWTISIVDELISKQIISCDDVQITSVNIGQSKLFCWLLIGKESEYMCTLTKESTDLLVRFIPDWCADIKEQSSASDITLRVKNPTKLNDSTQLVVSTSGELRYQGSTQNISKLPEALSIAIRSIISSKQLITFLDSLEYKEIPANF